MKRKKALVPQAIRRIGGGNLEFFKLALRLSDQDRKDLLADHMGFLTKMFKDRLKTLGIRRVNDLILGDRLRQKLEARLRKAPSGPVTTLDVVSAHVKTPAAHQSKIIIVEVP
jgi:hypothetical protein